MVDSALQSLAGVVLAVLLGTPCCLAQTVTAVPKIDLNQLNGTWYEIIRYPNKHEDKRCAGNGEMLVAPGDGNNHVQLVYACKTKAGYTDATNVDGKAADKLGDGRLKLGFWPFYRKFWVLAIAPDATWSLIGSPNHKDLWIYSKSTTPTPDLLTQIEAKAVAEGFNAGKLMRTTQGLPVTE